MEYPAKGCCCEPHKTKLEALNKHLEFYLLTKPQFQHQTSGPESNQPVEFALAGARAAKPQGQCQTHDNIWGSFMAPAEFLVSLCWGRAGLSLHHTEGLSAPKVSRSPLTETGRSIFRENIKYPPTGSCSAKES